MPSSSSITRLLRSPPRAYRPRDKGNVEAGVKVVTNWVIHFLEGRVFVTLDDLNAAIAEQVEVINSRVPFRANHAAAATGSRNSNAQSFSISRNTGGSRWCGVKRKYIGTGTSRSTPSNTRSRTNSQGSPSTCVSSVPSSRFSLVEVIAMHQLGVRKNGYVNPEHAPAHLTDTTGLWTRAYFTRQAAKVGPSTVVAIERLLDGRKIEAQGFRSCMNILDLGKSGNRMLLEQACTRLITDEYRQITYTAVKHALTAVRAEQDERPRSTPAADRTSTPAPVRPTGRDTSGAYCRRGRFSLDALTRKETGDAIDLHLTTDVPLHQAPTAFGEAVIEIANDPPATNGPSQRSGMRSRKRPPQGANAEC